MAGLKDEDQPQIEAETVKTPIATSQSLFNAASEEDFRI